MCTSETSNSISSSPMPLADALQSVGGFSDDINDFDAVTDAICDMSYEQHHALVMAILGITDTPTPQQTTEVATELARHVIGKFDQLVCFINDPAFEYLVDTDVFLVDDDETIARGLWEIRHECCTPEHDWHSKYWDSPEKDLSNQLSWWLKEHWQGQMPNVSSKWSEQEWLDAHPDCGFDMTPYEWDDNNGQNPKPPRFEWGRFGRDSLYARDFEEFNDQARLYTCPIEDAILEKVVATDGALANYSDPDWLPFNDARQRGARVYDAIQFSAGVLARRNAGF